MQDTPKAHLSAQIRASQSFLCVGLDPVAERLPKTLLRKAKHTEEAILIFCREIIEATQAYAVAYKLNIAFFEARGAASFELLRKVRAMVPKNKVCIADAKRGDIAYSAQGYARAFFEVLDFDAITLSPYMGRESVLPFLSHKGKWVIIVCLSSNSGNIDLQTLTLSNKQRVWEALLLQKWGPSSHVMFVIGGNQGDMLSRARALAPGYFFLVPAIGAQKGSVEEVWQKAKGDDSSGLLLASASRSILYASGDADYAQAAEKEARNLQEKMQSLLKDG